MDVLAAIGVAVNIMTLVDFGIQIFAAAKDVYSSKSGSLKANDDVATITQELRNLTIALEVKEPSTTMTEEERSLNRLVISCRRWSEELLALLDSLKTEKARSKRQTLGFVWRSLQHKAERNRLEKNLESCRQQLTIQLGEIAR